MRCPWLGRHYLGRTRVAGSTIRDVYGFEDVFHLRKRRFILHASLQWPQTVTLRQLVLIAWWSLLSILYIVYDIHSEIRRIRAEQKKAPTSASRISPRWFQAVYDIQCEAIILSTTHRLRLLTSINHLHKSKPPQSPQPFPSLPNDTQDTCTTLVLPFTPGLGNYHVANTLASPVP